MIIDYPTHSNEIEKGSFSAWPVNQIRKDVEQVYIKTAAKGKRIYDKLNSCFFCEKEYLKLGRHLQQVHSTEEEVEKALSYKVKDERRKQQFEKLCRMGNFNHNMKVLELKQGELKVVRRPSDNMDVNPDHYLPCKFCNGFLRRMSCGDMPPSARSRRVMEILYHPKGCSTKADFC